MDIYIMKRNVDHTLQYLWDNITAVLWANMWLLQTHTGIIFTAQKKGGCQQCHASVSKCTNNDVCIILSRQILNGRNSAEVHLWWCTLVIPALRRWRQEDCESEAAWWDTVYEKMIGGIKGRLIGPKPPHLVLYNKLSMTSHE
jgi:hypothetical protein